VYFVASIVRGVPTLPAWPFPATSVPDNSLNLYLSIQIESSCGSLTGEFGWGVWLGSLAGEFGLKLLRQNLIYLGLMRLHFILFYFASYV
jgi:hypothetical protein